MPLKLFKNPLARFSASLASGSKGSGSAKGFVNPIGAQIPVAKTGVAKPPFYDKNAISSGDALKRVERNLANTDITTYRRGSETNQVIKDLAIASPDLAASVNAYIRTAVTSKFTATAASAIDGSFDYDATVAVKNILLRFDLLSNFEEGFAKEQSVRSIAESLAKELRYYGAASMELVLDESGFPKRLQPVHVPLVQFAQTEDGLKPLMEINNEKVDLDIPTFFFVSVDQDLSQPYASSPMESAIQPILFQNEFFNDLRRIVRQAIHPRIKVKVDAENLLKQMPVEYRERDDGIRQYMLRCIADVADEINGLNPEDALVYLDSMDVSALYTSSNRHDAEIQAFQGVINSKVATGTQTLQSILGMDAGSSNIANTQSLLFVKTVEGAVQAKLNEIFSRALTLAARLLGYDVVVNFAFAPVDLRPESELEAFYAMKQSRLHSDLSLGLISTETYMMKMYGELPSPDTPDLSGTGFNVTKVTSANPDSNNAASQKRGGVGSDATKNAKSQNGGKEGNK